jgi:RNA polymerase sigma-70 factor (ECF subfamily)
VETTPLHNDSRVLVSDLAINCGHRLNRFLLARVRNSADVPDIAQEVYLRMLRVNAESVRSPEAYLFTVALHVVQQHTLRQGLMPAVEDLSEMLDPPHASSDHDPLLSAATDQFAESLERTLELLPAKARAAFILHRRDGKTPEEIAEYLGISRAMVKKYILKALVRLRVHADGVRD